MEYDLRPVRQLGARDVPRSYAWCEVVMGKDAFQIRTRGV